jgi:hypothetical protein
MLVAPVTGPVDVNTQLYTQTINIAQVGALKSPPSLKRDWPKQNFVISLLAG